MRYPYYCEKCDIETDVIKSMHDSSREECCIQCGVSMKRVWCAPEIIGASVQNAEYNPGLGEVVYNKKHQQELCKRKGLVEVGNDFSSGEKMQKHFDKAREEKRERSWDKALDD